MPSKKAKSAKKPASSTVTRIKATDEKPATKAVKTEKAKAAKAEPTTETKKVKRASKHGIGVIFVPFKAMGRYFKGAWVELRQVRWPTRRATWGLTGAVLAYSAFFVIVVLLLDAGFKYLFEFILKK